MKLNSLVDPAIIAALYEASNAGVEIKLIIRGVCSLIPGIKDLSENIVVTSIVGRYLEHSRVFYFYNDNNEEVYLSSADMMQRNLDRRVETAFPIENPRLKDEIIKILIKVSLKDNVKTRILQPDGSYKFTEVKDSTKKVNSQEWLMNHALKAMGVRTQKPFQK
jgi:polyphosphate kinase